MDDPTSDDLTLNDPALKPPLKPPLNPTLNEVERRELVPRVLSVLVGRGADFATAEDAVQEALIRALARWDDHPPNDPTGWLVTVAWRAFLDIVRSDAARRDREVRFDVEPPAGAVPSADDTLRLYFLCAHPELTSSSAVALTLRAVGGLTTRQIAQAYLVPEATMAQRISRAKRVVSRAGVSQAGLRPSGPDRRDDHPGDVATVMRVLYLVFNEGYSGDVDLAAEAIRLTRQMATLVDDPEVQGLLALMLLHESRRATRSTPDGDIILLEDQDRSRWDRALIAEGVSLIEQSLASGRAGPYTLQAAISAVHADASTPGETNWTQIVALYDLLLEMVPSAVVELNRAVALAMRDGPAAGLAAIDAILERGDLTEYHLAHSARAEFNRRLGDNAAAKASYEVALSLVKQEPERRFLASRVAELA